MLSDYAHVSPSDQPLHPADRLQQDKTVADIGPLPGLGRATRSRSLVPWVAPTGVASSP